MSAPGNLLLLLQRSMIKEQLDTISVGSTDSRMSVATNYEGDSVDEPSTPVLEFSDSECSRFSDGYNNDPFVPSHVRYRKKHHSVRYVLKQYLL